MSVECANFLWVKVEHPLPPSMNTLSLLVSLVASIDIILRLSKNLKYLSQTNPCALDMADFQSIISIMPFYQCKERIM